VTSARQWAANRENPQKSTGLRTDEAKRRTRRNALRHGLTAETVVDGLNRAHDFHGCIRACDFDTPPAAIRQGTWFQDNDPCEAKTLFGQLAHLSLLKGTPCLNNL
jgi:hypothetical protein